MSDTDKGIAETLAKNACLRQYSIDVKRDGDEVVLTGTVSSFYHKQVAQEAVRKHLNGYAPICQIRNNISVDGLQSRRI